MYRPLRTFGKQPGPTGVTPSMILWFLPDQDSTHDLCNAKQMANKTNPYWEIYTCTQYVYRPNMLLWVMSAQDSTHDLCITKQMANKTNPHWKKQTWTQPTARYMQTRKLHRHVLQ